MRNLRPRLVAGVRFPREALRSVRLLVGRWPFTPEKTKGFDSPTERHFEIPLLGTYVPILGTNVPNLGTTVPKTGTLTPSKWNRIGYVRISFGYS